MPLRVCIIAIPRLSSQLLMLYSKQLPAKRTLLNMCLVHRSWNATAHHFLGRFVTVRDNAEAYNLLANPLIGPSTQQLCYYFEPVVIPNILVGIRSYEGDYHEEPTPMTKEALVLSHVLSICTGIRVLEIYDLQMSSIGSDTFHRITQLQNLEVLSFGKSLAWGSKTSDALLSTYTALPNMRNLKSLTLTYFACPKGQVVPISIEELSPPSSLTNVDVRACSENKITEILFSWLFRPRKAYSVLSQ